MGGSATGKTAPARALVTGGAGFIGSHLTRALVAAGRPVRVLDNLSSGKRANLDEVMDRIEFIEGDITDAEDGRRACEGVEVVFHHAARVSVQGSILNPVATHETNALGTLRMLVAAREAGVRRLIYAGSASAYGDCADLPVRESAPARPLSPYAVAKLTGELYCRVFSDLYGLETVVLRYFNVFGPRQDPSSPYSGVIAQFAARLARGEGLTIYGDGLQTRDFVPVENIVAANLAAAESPQAAGKVINVGCARAMTINELAQTMVALSGAQCDIRHAEARAGDILHSVACTDTAQQCLGYRAAVTPEEGLKTTLAWYLGR